MKKDITFFLLINLDMDSIAGAASTLAINNKNKIACKINRRKDIDEKKGI